MQLLERQTSLDILEECLRDIRRGEGRIALVSGEAGVGKTTLVEHVAARHRGRERILWGRCDPLFTPSPLAPFREMAAQPGSPIPTLAEPNPSHKIDLNDLHHELQRAGPISFVIEDAHWADDATLDVIKFLGRRIDATQVLLVLTHRDDELDHRHPLRSLLAVLATCRAMRRIPLAPLSVEAVRELITKQPFDAETVHRQTGGNPFLVTELLKSGAAGQVPHGVRDIVLQRASRLSGAARNVLEAAAIIGQRAEARLLRRVVGVDADATDQCIALGLLRIDGETVATRHELTRQAVIESIAPPRRALLHGLVLKALMDLGENDASLLAHHADAAGEAEAVRRYAAAAGEQARDAGSHREAAAQLARALRYTARERGEERARLLEALAAEETLLDRQSEAVRSRREAADLRRELGDRNGEGANLAAMAWPLVRSGLNREADESCRRAVAILESLGPSREFAAALRMQAHLRMLDRDKGAAIALGHRAIAMAETTGDTETLISSHIVVGASMLVTDDPRGRAFLDRSIALAREHGFDGLVALAYLNIGSSYGEQYRFAEAELQLKQGASYAAERDLDHAQHYTLAWLAITHLYQGRWSETGDIAMRVLGSPELAVVSRIMALVALGRLRARRGDPGAREALDEALELARRTGTLQRLGPVHAARAEAAWLSGRRDRIAPEVDAVWDLAVSHRHPWHVGELAFWRARVGEGPHLPEWAARPFRCQIEGAWRDAALAWDERGCPYERARALSDGDEAACREALAVFDRLGARPMAEILRQRLRSAGIGRVPRGPRSATRDNTFGLTLRQAEILAMLAAGLTNGAIARRLHISAKTVDHHVSAILAKLGVSSRLEVARFVAEASPSSLGGSVKHRESPQPE